MLSRDGGHCVFQIVCPRAQRMYLVGDFNGWSRTAVMMEQVCPGLWQTSLDLEPGTYRFRYFTGQVWLMDYASFGLLPNGLGGWDSVVWIPADEQRAHGRVNRLALAEGSAQVREVPRGDLASYP
jgi:1,4-alpha-glucan branching enzyme